ncbi:MAG: hypothetical protein LKF42_09540 [Streptococcaceae bacterium]|nr:hypothetical protein [Streptococcaceae bacterium]MCH4178105.1 hypothetical protein [Streptococcaceae bacterium]
MNLMEFKGLLETIDIPVEYQAFPVGNAPKLPYILWYEDDSDNFKADNVNYFDVINVVVELYSDEKDLELETKLSKLFYDNEIEYDFNESFIEDENMYLKAYEVTITFDSLANVQPDEVNKSQLKLLVDYSDTLQADYYIEESFNKFKTTLAYAKAVLVDEDATQSEVNDSAEDLIQSLSQLALIAIDKSKLQSQIDYANSLTSSNYTIETWSFLMIAKANAQNVLTNNNANQSEVDSILIELFEAINNLKSVEGGFTKGVNFYAPLYWESQGLGGGLNYDTGEVNDFSWYVHSNYIQIPNSAINIAAQTNSSDSIYLYFYDKNKKYINYTSLYQENKIFNIKRDAEYLRIYSNKQTPSSLLTNKTKIEWDEQTEYSVAPEDEPLNILTRI